jgi:hypothetical protein
LIYLYINCEVFVSINVSSIHTKVITYSIGNASLLKVRVYIINGAPIWFFIPSSSFVLSIRFSAIPSVSNLDLNECKNRFVKISLKGLFSIPSFFCLS